MFDSNKSNGSKNTLLLAILIALVIIRGYAIIYPHALDFVVTRPSIPISDQESVATFITVMYQCVAIYFLCCCHWSLKSFKRGNFNPWFYIFYGAMGFPFLTALLFCAL